MSTVADQAEKLLQCLTQDEFYATLKLAKEAYITRTGKIDEEADEYESRMNSFNDWYLFNYKRDDGRGIIEGFTNDSFETEIIEAFLKTNYSLFVFHKINFRKQIILKDILHGNKFILSPKNGMLALVEGDVFVGRSVTYQEENYLLNGICILPSSVLSPIKKEAKKVRKLNNLDEEESFLLNLERLKTKSIQYAHIDISKIFTF